MGFRPGEVPPVTKREKEYRRLTRTRRGLAKGHSLWLGKDHILAVESTGYTEEYRRYYFRDIQGIVTRRTDRRDWLSGIFLIPVLLLAWPALKASVSGNSGGVAGWGIPAGAFLVLILVNIFRGPTCRTWIQMPLTVDELPSLDRIPKVRRVLETLRPLVASAQGTVRRSEIPVRAAQERPAPPPLRPAPAPASAERRGEPESGYDGRIHRIFFSLLLLNAVETPLALYFPSAMQPVNAIVALFLIGFMVAALAKQHTFRVPKTARVLVWVAGGTMAAVTVAAVVYGFYFIFSSAFAGRMKPDAFRLEPLDHPFLVALSLVDIAVSLYAGGKGLLVMEELRGNEGKG
jgi:hypothetical protein